MVEFIQSNPTEILAALIPTLISFFGAVIFKIRADAVSTKLTVEVDLLRTQSVADTDSKQNAMIQDLVTAIIEGSNQRSEIETQVWTQQGELFRQQSNKQHQQLIELATQQQNQTIEFLSSYVEDLNMSVAKTANDAALKAVELTVISATDGIRGVVEEVKTDLVKEYDVVRELVFQVTQEISTLTRALSDRKTPEVFTTELESVLGKLRRVCGVLTPVMLNGRIKEEGKTPLSSTPKLEVN